MATNSTLPLSQEVKFEIFRHIIYAIEGSCIIFFNSLVALTIWRHEALVYMKEYVALAALALADALGAVGTLSAAVYRIHVWLSHRDLESVSGRFCLLTPHNIFWGLFMVASQLMLVVVSLDRVLSAAIPLIYMSFTRTYMARMVSAAYASSFALYAAIFTTNWPITEPIRTKVCWSSEAFGMEASVVVHLVTMLATLSSIGLYMLIPIFYRSNSVAPAPTNSTNGADFQKQLNKSAAISCMFTFLCVGLPWVVVFAASLVLPESYESIAVWLLIVINVNPAVNFFIYYHKLKYFRIGVHALFRNKTLPPLVNNWHETAV